MQAYGNKHGCVVIAGIDSFLQQVAVFHRVGKVLAQKIHKLVAIDTVNEDVQVEAFIGERIVEPVGEFGFRISKEGAVLFVYYSVLVQVFEDEVTYPCFVGGDMIVFPEGRPEFGFRFCRGGNSHPYPFGRSRLPS